MVDFSKIKVGDEITVRMKVLELSNTETLFPIRAGTGTSPWCCLRKEDIATHTPAPPREFKPGDKVTWGLCLTEWEFVTSANGMALIKFGKDSATIVPLSDIAHADGDEK